MVEPAGSELLIDYTKVPTQDLSAPSRLAQGQAQRSGLCRIFVYKNMHDFCRRVSRDVVIGQATRLGKPIHQYFVLVRGAVQPETPWRRRPARTHNHWEMGFLRRGLVTVAAVGSGLYRQAFPSNACSRKIANTGSYS